MEDIITNGMTLYALFVLAALALFAGEKLIDFIQRKKKPRE